MQSRLITTTVEGINIVNVYIPNGQAVGSEKFVFKLDWMNRLREFFDTRYDPSTPVLLCGDFNVAPEDRDVHDVRLWQGRIMFSEQERATLQHIKDWGFTDAFRLHEEAGGKFTWWDYRAGAFRRNMGLRIDHVWVTKPLVSRSVRAWIDMAPRTWEKPSDHAPLLVEFEPQKAQKTQKAQKIKGRRRVKTKPSSLPLSSLCLLCLLCLLWLKLCK